MKMRGLWAIAFLVSLATACYAAQKGKNQPASAALTPAQLGDSEATEGQAANSQTKPPLSTKLGDYSLNLDTVEHRYIGTPDPAGLTPLKQESVFPGVGLKLSRPLPDNFWNFGEKPAQ